MVTIVRKVLDAVKRVVCRNCSTELEYTQSEVQRRDGKDWTGGSDGDESIVCPSCGKKVILRSW